jgi:hypothetical protein
VIGDEGIAALRRQPTGAYAGQAGKSAFKAHIAIPNYASRVEKHYADLLPNGLAAACEAIGIAPAFDHFGLIIDFEQPAELQLYDADTVISDDLRNAIDAFGPVIMRNAHVQTRERGNCQHNIFPDLRFHVDRGGRQPNQISMYTRDCSDPVQAAPRTSSTIFIANAVGPLQAKREANGGAAPDDFRIRYDIFKTAPLDPLLGDIVLDQPWTAQTTVGEIAAIDNRSVLHASYYRNQKAAGYAIGTRYLV